MMPFAELGDGECQFECTNTDRAADWLFCGNAPLADLKLRCVDASEPSGVGCGVIEVATSTEQASADREYNGPTIMAHLLEAHGEELLASEPNRLWRRDSDAPQGRLSVARRIKSGGFP
jgi:hypothetical protein